MRLRRRGDAPPAVQERQVPLQAHAVAGNLLAGGDGVWAWYRLSDAPYWFTDVAHRRQHRSAVMARFADLVGHRLQFRITEHPVAAKAWASDFRSRTAARARTPESARAESWDDVVDLMRDRIEELPALTVPAGYVGVRLAREKANHQQLRALLAGETPRGLKDTADALLRVDHVVAGEGWSARPVTGRRLAWLIASSLTPGLPVSSESLAGADEGWDDATMEEFVAPVRTTAEPWAPAVRIEALRQGRMQTVYAAVASLSRTPARFEDDPRAPLFAWGLGLPWKVQWCADVDVVDGHDLAKRATRVREELDDQIDHMHELRRKPPLRLTRLRDEAARVEDDRTNPLLDVRVRLVGTVRALVTGGTRDEAVSRLDELVRRAVRDQGAVLSTHPGQWAAVRSFVPGEHDPTTATGFVREVPAALAATWGPNTSTRVLDEAGPYRGWTTRRATTPVFWSPQDGPAHGRSGLTVICAIQGGGKTYAAASTWELEVRMGHLAHVLDPSGLLRRLLELPALRKTVREIDLQHAASGMLSPWRLVPDPVREDYAPAAPVVPLPAAPSRVALEDAAVREEMADRELRRDRAFESARAAAEEERRSLAVELLLSRLPAQLVEDSPDARIIVRAGVNAVGGAFGTDPWDAVDAIGKESERGKAIARIIRDSATARGGRLILPPPNAKDGATDVLAHDPVLITAPNMPVPAANLQRRQWSEDEQLAAGLMRAAAWFLTRAIYLTGQDPKFVDIEEAGDIGGSEAVRGLAQRASLHTRKSNAALLLSLQNPSRLLDLDPEIGNLIGTMMIGRSEDPGAAAAALRLAGLSTEFGGVVQTLRTGEMLVRDHWGRAATVHWDSEYRTALHEALRSNPPATSTDIDITGVEVLTA
ncbi:MAG TPA: hypothetical protein VEV65_10200 [Kineosporiaceae bacterium]|nr:hypothetical protein [Kineosporiaceae bacterium]